MLPVVVVVVSLAEWPTNSGREAQHHFATKFSLNPVQLYKEL